MFIRTDLAVHAALDMDAVVGPDIAAHMAAADALPGADIALHAAAGDAVPGPDAARPRRRR